MIQIAIALFGATAIYLVSRDDWLQRWGYISGMIGQPFWFYATYSSEQWGIFALCVFYTYSWANGIWNYWIKPAWQGNIARTYKQYWFSGMDISKPPKGIMPRYIHREKRFSELCAAIARYNSAGKPIPEEWKAEHKDLSTELQNEVNKTI